MYPLPVGNPFCDAAVQWNQEKDRNHRSKHPDRIRCKQDSEPWRVPVKPGLDTEHQGTDWIPDRHDSSEDKRETAEHLQLCFGVKPPCGGVYKGRDRKLDPYQRDDKKDGGD